MLFIDVLPETPSVATAFFQVKKYLKAGMEAITSKWIWELISGKKAVAINIPAEVPPIYYGLPRPKNWLNYFVYPKQLFRESVLVYHDFVKNNLNVDVGFIWYMIPDQAHHYFFPTIHDIGALKKAIEWYDFACKLALDLIESFKPKCWIVLSDHGFTSDVRDTVFNLRYHIRDGVAITNCGHLPRYASEVIYWIAKTLGIG